MTPCITAISSPICASTASCPPGDGFDRPAASLPVDHPLRAASNCLNDPRQNVTFAVVSTTKHRRLLPGLSVADGFMRHPFDLAHGVRTSGLIAGRHLKSGHPHDRHATAYYGVAPSVFRRLLQRWKRSKPCAPISAFTFLDVGAGMGRAVLLACNMPFLEVRGV